MIDYQWIDKHQAYAVCFFHRDLINQESKGWKLHLLFPHFNIKGHHLHLDMLQLYTITKQMNWEYATGIYDKNFNRAKNREIQITAF